jgi:hypothetical protein
MIRYPYVYLFIIILIVFQSLIVFEVEHSWSQNTKAKKIIYYGWGIRDTQYVKDQWQEMERMPFDGAGIRVAIDRNKPTTGNGTTANQLGWLVMGPRLFVVEEFRDAIKDLKAAKWRKFSDNFLPVALSSSASAADLNWFDENRWEVIAKNFSVLAKIASKSGIKGLILDPEDYNYNLFSYQNQQKQVGRSFEDYIKMARQRGREVMSRITESMPNVVILSLFGYTLPLSEMRKGISLREANYGLLPAFYDGLLEAMPASTQLIDGYEFAYGFKHQKQFLKAYSQINQEAIVLSTVPNQYRKKVRAAFGLMLDYRGRVDYFTPEEFQMALHHALRVSDGYVWVYAERPQFFPLSNIEAPYIEAIFRARMEFGR